MIDLIINISNFSLSWRPYFLRMMISWTERFLNLCWSMAWSLVNFIIFRVRNLYHYFCTVNVFKILKFRQPITLYEMYQLSHRETSLALILPERSGQFFYKSALAWNSVYRSVLERPNSDLTTKISHFKDEIKKLLSSKQNEGENIDWQKSNFILY